MGSSTQRVLRKQVSLLSPAPPLGGAFSCSSICEAPHWTVPCLSLGVSGEGKPVLPLGGPQARGGTFCSPRPLHPGVWRA